MATPRRTPAAVPDQRKPKPKRTIEYPTSDGKPMAETDIHRDDMGDLIATLNDFFAAEPDVYISGNLLLFYEEGNRHKHVAPDVFLVRGVPKLPPREHYLLWEEGKAPDVVIEITSKTTKKEDQTKKPVLYREVLKVPEYFRFDPKEQYLKPPLQGSRLEAGQYVPIVPVEGRLPSAVLGLHLERRGTELRLYDPAAGRYLPTRAERAREAQAAQQRAEAAQQRAEAAQQRAEAAQQRAEQERQREAEARQRAEQERQRVEQENERLQRELEALRRKLSGGT
jgi:Uma2 family endonuclease